MELCKQVFARLHPGRNVSLDMIQECCHSLHRGPEFQPHAGTACPWSDVAERHRSALTGSICIITSCPGSSSVL